MGHRRSDASKRGLVRRLGPSAALLACAVLAFAATPLADDEAEASEALARAESDVEKGRYAKAVTAYRVIADKWGHTAAGRVASARSQPTAFIGACDIQRHGPSSNRVDVVVMGDGYQLEQQDAFDDIAKTVPRLFEQNRTLEEYLPYFNFLRMNLVSKDAGVDGLGREFETALGGYIRGQIQGHVGVDNRLVQRFLDELPEHDGLAIVYVKRGEQGTGGGGVATIGGRNERTTIHEWGHAFAELQDEYAQVNMARRRVRNHINVSNTEDPEGVPWRHWLEADVRGIGVYEGAAGQERGAWKPTPSGCLMERGEFLCRVCREAVVLRIYELVDPIDTSEPPPHPRSSPPGDDLLVEGKLAIEVKVLRPSSHDLDVHWWVLPEVQAPAEPPGVVTTSRRERGRLAPIESEPTARTRPNRHGLHVLELSQRKMEPGRYRVVCRAVDDTRISGDRYPWVLKDDHGLLESERAWWVKVE